MARQDTAAALQRVASALQRRPHAGLHEDPPAVSRWDGGSRVVTRHANGQQVVSDLPDGLGGDSAQVTPSWLLRAGLASCSATRIAMAAASQGIELDQLEVRAASRSDTRGLFGLAGADGSPAYAGPQELQLHVRIAARGVAPERLRALVEHSHRLSPVVLAMQDALPLQVHIEIAGP